MKNTLTDRTEAESPQAGSRLLISYYVGVILLSFSSISMAESWSDRTDFAQSYFGVGAELLPAVNLNNGSPEIPARTINRLSWGGLHFWRHVDFEISIPISGTDMQSNGVASSFEAGSSYGFSTNIYPWSLEPNSIRPFFGFGFLSGFSFAAGSSINNAPVYAENIIPLKVGLSKRMGNFIFEAGYQKIPVEKFTYYTSRTTSTVATVASDTFYAALKYNFETSKGATENQRLRSTAYTIGIGPSSSFGTGSLDYNTVNRPWVSDKPFQFNYVTEYDLGYFIYDYEIQMNLAYKNANSSVNGYNLRQSFQRNSITLEAFKYLFDYHGFVPYIGPNINFDTFSFSETDSGIKTIDDSETLISPGVTLGWDIKPVDKMRLVLRTNLRWTFPTPQLFSGKPYQMPANQFEFNFIQFVLFL